MNMSLAWERMENLRETGNRGCSFISEPHPRLKHVSSSNTLMLRERETVPASRMCWSLPVTCNHTSTFSSLVLLRLPPQHPLY